MTDRLTPSPPSPNPTISLASEGRLWGRLSDDGRFLEVAERGHVVTFDLWQSTQKGRAVVVEVGKGED